MLGMGYRSSEYLMYFSLYLYFFHDWVIIRHGKKEHGRSDAKDAAEDEIGVGKAINASGHKQELDRNFSLLSI